MKNSTPYKLCLKSLSAALLLFSTQLVLANTFSGDDHMPFGWIQEKIDWTDAAHIWNPQKIQQLQERGEYTSLFATSLWGPFGTEKRKGIILNNDCDNLVEPGSIGYNQEFCEPNSDPEEIVSLTPPSGGSGNIEYIWLIKVGSGDWETIPGSTGASYDPGPLSQPTFFRRCARRSGCEEYIETDIVHITFLIPTVLEVSKECVEDESGKYQVDLNASHVNEVFANGERIYPPYIITADSGQLINIVATGDCGTIERTITDEGVDYTVCEETICVAPVITIAGSPVCNADNESYTVDFTVTDADSVFVNSVLQAGTGPDFSVVVPEGQNASIRATNECDSDNRSVEAPICNELCPVTIMIPTEGNPVCNDDNETYTVTFTVEGADSVFVNEVFYTPTSGNTYTLTFPRGVRTCIFAWKYNEDGSPLCRANREIDAPPCCDDPSPSIPTIVTECNDDNTTYTLTATVLNADEVRVNGELVTAEATDPTKYVVILPIGTRAEIEAITECDGQKLRAFRSAESPVCNCPKPVIEITEKTCDAEGQNYTISFTVTGADSVYLNGELLAGTGPDFSGSLPTAEDAIIRAVKDCGDVKAEATATTPAPCCLPTPTIVINEKFCSPDSTNFTLTFTVTDADEVFVNDVLQTEAGPQYTVTLPASDTARILVKNECAQASRQEVAICCPKPEIIISFDENPVCNDDGETYTLDFTVTGAVSVSVNNVELEGAGPDYSITLPNGTRACIVATADCGNRGTREVEAPVDCPPPCPTPEISIDPDGEPVCSEDGTMYTFSFTVDPAADSLFINGELSDEAGPNYTVTLPIAQTAEIRAVAICGDLTAEDNLTVTPPNCCPEPEISIDPDGEPTCSEDGTMYTFSFTVDPAADSLFINGELSAEAGPNYTVTLPIAQTAEIRAVAICGDLTAEDNLTVTPPNCCPEPEISIDPDGEPTCSEDGTMYTFSFTVDPAADSLFINGELSDEAGPNYTVTLPIAQTAEIRAVAICGDLTAEDNLTVTPPNCCPEPEISIDPDGEPVCSEDGTMYTFSFTVDPAADSLFINGELSAEAGPNYTVTLPIAQTAEIRAVAICGDLTAEDNLTVTPPNCCPEPEISIDPDGEPVCSEDGTMYTFSFTVDPAADSLFINGELSDEAGPNYTVTLPIAQTAEIRAVAICGDLTAEDNLTVTPPNCCPEPEISIDPDGEPVCSEDGTMYTFSFTVDPAADSLFINGELSDEAGPNYTVTLPIAQTAEIRAVAICGDLTAEDNLTVTPPNCCPEPEISIDPDGEPTCSEDGTMYTFSFTVDPAADSLFINGELSAEAGPNYTVTLPIAQTAEIRAVAICGDLTAEDNLTVTPPNCCPEPEISIDPDGEPVCSEDGTMYTFSFTVDPAADSLFINGELSDEAGPNYTVTLPIAQTAEIRAVAICGDLTAEDNLTVTPPNCCPEPEISIDPDGEPVCSEDGTMYTFSFTVDPAADSLFINGELSDEAGPNYTVTLPIAQTAEIRAVAICGDLTAEDNLTVTPPNCCPEPEISIDPDGEPVCSEDGTMYTFSFTVDPAADSLFINGELSAEAGPNYTVTLPIAQTAEIRAVAICGDLTAEDNLTVTPPNCCPEPEISIDPDGEPVCSEDGTMYTFSFTVDPAADSLFINGELSAEAGPNYTVTLPIAQTAEIRAVAICGDLTAEDNLTVTPPNCCPEPEISIDPDGEPVCSEDGTMYTFSFTVDPAADSLFINGELSAEAGPNYTVTLPIAQTAEIRAVAICGDLTAEDNLTVTPPNCCPEPEISIDPDGEPTCSEDGTMYTFSFTVDPAADSLFINGELSAEAGPNYTVTLPIAQTAEIRAVAICGDLTAEDNLTVTPPNCCPEPEISIDPDGEPTCSEDGTMYTFSFTVDPAADSLFINGELSDEAGPNYTVTLPIAQTAEIRAVAICGDLTAEDNLTVTPPNCCPEPEISIDPDGEPVCSEDGTMYTFSFKVDPAADSLFINGELSDEAGPNYTVTLPIAQTAEIRAVAICGDLTAEDNLTVTPPNCCPEPEISIDPDGEPVCSEDGTMYTFSFKVDPAADSLFINGELSAEAGPNYTVTLPIAQTAEIRAVAICGDLTAEDNLTVTPPNCCPEPEISIDPDGEPVCSEDGTMYTFSFTVDPAADSLFINGELSAEAGPNYTVTLPIAQTAEIRAVAICGDLTAEDNLTVTPPNCCPEPEISIDPDGEPVCSEDGTMYTFSFTVDPAADSLFINGELSAEAGPNYTVTLPIAQTAEIRAVAICGDLTAEDNLTVTPPNCCPEPEISIDPDGEPVCSEDGTMYTFSFTVDPAADSLFINGQLSDEAGPNYTVTLPIAQTAEIRAVAICGDLTAEDNLTVTPPNCCPEPEISIDPDGEPVCSEDGTMYTFSFTVDPAADSLFINGELSDEAGPNYTVTLPIAQTAEIRAVAICGDLTAEDNLTVTPPNCCPEPEISIDPDGEPVCSEDGTMYTFSFTVDPAADSLFINGELSDEAGPNYTVTLPIAQTAEIRAVAICGDLTAEDNLTVTPPNCCNLTVIVDADPAEICPDSCTILTADIMGGSGNYELIWTGPNVQNIGDSLAIEVCTPGTYFVTVKDLDLVCAEAVDSVAVTLKEVCAECDLTVEVSTDLNTVCPERGLCTTLTAVTTGGTPAFSYTWFLDDVLLADSINAAIEVCTPGNYRVEVIDEEQCDASSSIDITENCPECDIDVNIIASDESLTDCSQILTAEVIAGTGPFTYIWTKDGVEVGNSESLNVTGQTGNYVLTVIDAENCDATRILRITPCCPSPQTVEELVFFPNGFSPNGDGINDELRFVVEVFEGGNPLADLDATVVIYNRWGEILYNFTSFEDTWDGTFRGQLLPPDVYGYYLQLRCASTGEVVMERRGNLTILH